MSGKIHQKEQNLSLEISREFETCGKISDLLRIRYKLINWFVVKEFAYNYEIMWTFKNDCW